MIDVKLFDEKDDSPLTEFKTREWPIADREHGWPKQTDFSRPKFVLIAKENDTIVGYIAIFVDMGVAFIESVIVGKNYRARGLGTQLIRAGEERAKTMGAHKIRLETGVDWPARKLYEKLGYRVRASLPDYFAHRDFVMLDKEL